MAIPYDTFGTYWFIHRSIIISPYTVIAIIAASVGIIMAYFEMKRRKFGKELRHIILSSIIIYIFIILFARIFYFFGPWSWQGYHTFASRILDIFSSKAGMVFYGGLIGGVLGMFVYTRIKKISFWRFADIWMPSTGIILFIARMGCYTSGCCYGIASSLNLPWLIQKGNQTIHPTEIYHSFFGLLLFIAATELKYRQKSKKMFDGYVALWGIILYTIGRFLVEFLRYYPIRFLGLSASQIISIVLFLICLILLIFKYRKHKNKV